MSFWDSLMLCLAYFLGRKLDEAVGLGGGGEIMYVF